MTEKTLIYVRDGNGGIEVCFKHPTEELKTVKLSAFSALELGRSLIDHGVIHAKRELSP